MNGRMLVDNRIYVGQEHTDYPTEEDAKEAFLQPLVGSEQVSVWGSGGKHLLANRTPEGRCILTFLSTTESNRPLGKMRECATIEGLMQDFNSLSAALGD